MKKILILFLIVMFLMGCQVAEEPAETEAIAEPAVQQPTEQAPEEPSLGPSVEEPSPLPSFVDATVMAGDGNRGVIEPETVTIQTGSTIRWTNRNERRHLMVCYLSGQRVFRSDSLNPDEFSEYTFTEPGEYTCQDVIYGSRSTVTVE